MTCYIKSARAGKTDCNSRGKILVGLLLTVSLIILSFVYLAQANSLVGSSYRLRQLENNLDELQTKNQELETKTAQYQSPANLNKMIQSLGWVSAQNVLYWEPEMAMAVKQ